MYLCEMTGAKKYIYKYMVLQLFHSKVQTEFLRQYLQSSSCSLDKIQKLGGPERSEEKMCFIEISIYV